MTRPSEYLPPFTLTEPSLEELSERLAQLYSRVEGSHYPLFSWVQIANDVTILGEELRRERQAEAVERAGKILFRLLEFIGYYLYVHEFGSSGFTDLLAKTFRQKSFNEWFKNGPKEGPTRWILAKYPSACSKCGGEQCQCLLNPSALENRREKPEEYRRRFKAIADQQRKTLEGLNPPLFTLQSLIEFFRRIYHANYYHQDAWKIGMHLSEEFGEATTELSRLELRVVAPQTINLPSVLELAFLTAKEKLLLQTKVITGEEKERTRDAYNATRSRLEEDIAKDPWGEYERLVGEKLKEEIADVLSWIVAIIIKLDEKHEFATFNRLPDKFTREYARGVYGLRCPWCLKPFCDDTCLVAHAFSSEIVENVSKF